MHIITYGQGKGEREKGEKGKYEFDVLYGKIQRLRNGHLWASTKRSVKEVQNLSVTEQ